MTTILRGVRASGPLRVNDRVQFEASDTAQLRAADSGGPLTTGSGSCFRIIRLGAAIDLGSVQ